jgi:PilZ domain
MPQRKEKRRTPRIQPYVVPCRILDGDRRLPGYLMDLSVRGARVTCEQDAPAVGQLIVLEVRFARRHGRASLGCRVQWSRPLLHPAKGSEFGVTFEGLAPREKELLEAVVRDVHSQAEQLTR